MNAEISRVSLIEDIYAYAGRQTNSENAEEFKKQVISHISKIKNVVDADIENLSDEDFFKLLVSVYSIGLDMDDYLELFSKKYNKNYTWVTEIPTTMTFTGRATEGHGRSFDWWEQLYQVQYVAAISDDMEFDYNKVYSKKEIEKLVSDKTIILLEQKDKPINKRYEDFKEESFQYFPIDFDFDQNGNIMSGFILDNYGLYIEMLRKKFTKRKILMDMQDYICDLRTEIDGLIQYSKFGDGIHSEISRLCKEWYETSGTKSDFKLLQKRFNQKRN